MPWARFDDRFPDHEKIVPLSNSAFRLHVTAICYANAQLTDGYISVGVLRRIGWACDDLDADVAQLCAHNLWERAEEGYLVHDYLEYNPSREEELAKQQRISNERSKAGKAGMARRWGDNKDNKAIANQLQLEYQNDNPVPGPLINYVGESEQAVADAPDTPEETPALEKVVQSRTPTKQQEMVGALAQVCQMDVKLKTNAKRCGLVAKELLEASYTPDDVTYFGVWWLTDKWRAENTPIPTLPRVQSYIAQAKRTAPGSNGSNCATAPPAPAAPVREPTWAGKYRAQRAAQGANEA